MEEEDRGVCFERLRDIGLERGGMGWRWGKWGGTIVRVREDEPGSEGDVI